METARPRAVGLLSADLPAFVCCSSQLIKGLKYSIIARVEMSSRAPIFGAAFFQMLFSHVPTSLLSA